MKISIPGVNNVGWSEVEAELAQSSLVTPKASGLHLHRRKL